MRTYLSKKYHSTFVMKTTDYNYLSETYQAYAYPLGHSELVFMVEQDVDAKNGYSDTYPKVFWESELSGKIKAKIKGLFPKLDKRTFKAVRIVERGEFFGPHVPTYEEVHASGLACSITINMKTNWEHLNQNDEVERMKKLAKALKAIHFPVLVEVRYYEKERHVNEMVYYITEDGNIMNKE